MLLHLSPITARFCQHPVHERHSIPATLLWAQAPMPELTLTTSLLMRPPLLVARLDNGMCVKMRSSAESIRAELQRYLSMPPDVQAAYVPILCAFEVQLGDRLWAGLCMPYMEHTMCHLLPSGKDLETLAHNVTYDDVEQSNMGMPVLATTTETATTLANLLLCACFRLLLQVHAHGWVHGDTHLGNFMLCAKTWRVYLIDAERSFASTDPVQHFLDAQELFGHVTGMMVSLRDRCRWDLSDITGVTAKMHPRLTDQGTPLNNFMPVCSCFVQEKQECRERGCSMCHSALNASQAQAYKKHAHTWLRKMDACDLPDLALRIQACRSDVRAEILHLIEKLTPSIPFLRRSLQGKPSQRKLTVLLHAFYEDPSTMNVWFKYALYRGALVKDGSMQARAFVKLLTTSGLHGLAKDFSDTMAVAVCDA